jgi:hypothetical protein
VLGLDVARLTARTHDDQQDREPLHG